MRGALVRLISPFIASRQSTVIEKEVDVTLGLMLMSRFVVFCVFPAESDFLFAAPVEPSEHLSSLHVNDSTLTMRTTGESASGDFFRISIVEFLHVGQSASEAASEQTFDGNETFQFHKK